MVAVPEAVLAVLSAAQFHGPRMVLPAALARPLYLQAAKVIEAAGGAWNRKAGAHTFPGDAMEAIEPILLTGTYTRQKQELGAFYTPSTVANHVVALADLRLGMEVLEPSAGRGALATPVRLSGCHVDCVEIAPASAIALRSLGFRRVVEGDFLQQPPAPDYDRVIMNPPFARQADIDHVLRAMQFLRPGGRLVAIMSAGVTFRQDRKASVFRALLEECGGDITPLPAGSFRTSGTDVNTVIVTLPG